MTSWPAGIAGAPSAVRADQVSPASLTWPSVSVTLAIDEVPPQHRPHHPDQSNAHDDGHDDLGDQATAEGRSRGTSRCSAGEHEKDEIDGQRLDGAEDEGDPEPGQPGAVTEPFHLGLLSQQLHRVAVLSYVWPCRGVPARRHLRATLRGPIALVRHQECRARAAYRLP